MKWGGGIAGGGGKKELSEKGQKRFSSTGDGGGEVCLYFLLYFLSLLFDVLAGHFLVGLRGRALILYW